MKQKQAQVEAVREFYGNFRDARVVSVLKVEVNEGDGSHDDPVRRVAYLISFAGKVLARLGDDRDRKFSGEDEMVCL